MEVTYAWRRTEEESTVKNAWQEGDSILEKLERQLSWSTKTKGDIGVR